MNRLFYLWLFPFLLSCSKAYFNGEQRFKQFVQKDFEEQVQKNPEFSSLLGLKSNRGQWNDLSESFLQVRHKKVNKNLKELSHFDVSSFSKKSQLSWKLFKSLMEEEKTNFDFRFHQYITHPLLERPSQLTTFLINVHTIENIQSAKNYLDRVRGIQKHLDQVMTLLQHSAKRGLVPPRFIFPIVEENIRSLLQGLDSQGEPILLYDFNKKISALNLSSFKKKKLNEEIKQAFLEFYQPAYEKFLKDWRKLKVKSENKAGLWSQPQGRQYYEFLIRQRTASNLTPEKIHALGLKEVQRLHLEITQLKSTLNFKGSLLNFFNFFRNSRKFYHRNREVYLTQSRAAVSEVKKSLPEFFKNIPRHPVKVQRMTGFREIRKRSFYQPPSLKGGRPGIFYINLYRMNEQPKYALKPLAFRETFPGHHLQISLALDLKSLPKFQRHVQFSAFTKGWALYAERLAGEMGFYTKNQDSFGVLASELMRACGLVVDTGIHYKKWSRDQAIEYFIQNSDLSYDSAVWLVENSILNPGQAASYTIGFLKILELRTLAKKTLGDQFDIKEFHHQVLKNGAVPLMLLEENIRTWLKLS